MINNSGIYQILNLINNKSYIGSAKNLLSRWRSHRYELRGKRHKNKYLQSAWDKYGENSFEFKVFEIIDNPSNLLIREQHYLDSLQTYKPEIGYNLVSKAGSTLGMKHSEETKRKNGDRHRNKLISENQKSIVRKLMTGSGNPMYGKTHTNHSRSLMKLNHQDNSCEKNPSAKVTKEKVLQIRSEYQSGQYTQTELSKKYGINQRSISNIVLNKTWKTCIYKK